MKKLVGIFAHPDDEAFGPGGTLALEAQSAEVYIICITNGDAVLGTVAEQKKLGRIRKKELQKSCEMLGVKKVFFLGYHDGSLNHNLYHEIADKLKKLLEELQPDTLMTFEPRGVSGHIDHIVASMVTSFVFHKLPYIHTLMYYCNRDAMRQLMKDYFIYMPQGYKEHEVQKIVDTSAVWDTKVQAMNMHKSQQHDIDRILGMSQQLPKEEYFLVVKK